MKQVKYFIVRCAGSGGTQHKEIRGMVHVRIANGVYKVPTLTCGECDRVMELYDIEHLELKLV